MNEDERWKFIEDLDEELLKGGVLLSEWCVFIVREADTAFTKEANLACILTAMAGIETYLRSEYSSSGKEHLYELINLANFDPELTDRLHFLRKYRNGWVHVDDPWSDESLIENPQQKEQELEKIAQIAERVLRQVIYANPLL